MSNLRIFCNIRKSCMQQTLLARCLLNDSAYIPNNEHSTKEDKEHKSYGYKKYAAGAALAFSLYGAYHFYTLDKRKASSEIETPVQNKDEIAGGFKEGLKSYSMEEIRKHDSEKNRIWVTYKQGVYDITDFVEKHPGGSSKIMMAAGGSVDPFWMVLSNHKTEETYKLLETMRIGNISEDDAKSSTADLNDPYANEPRRHVSLRINNQKPFNAETPGMLLISSFNTPKELFYVRNHLPVPEVDPETYELELAVGEDTKKTLKLDDIKKYPKYTVTSAIMCAGNRRSEMTEFKPVHGLSWRIGAVGNATWSGAKLCDVLKDLGINEDDYEHVQFEGLDLDPAGVPYGASVPISKAMDPRGDAILAYEMNGEPISRDHGFPLRAVVPGIAGARNVKWLGRIIISKQESQSHFQQGDYKTFSPSTNWDNVDFSKAPAIQELPVISAVCTPQPGELVKVENGKIVAEGYALSGGGQKIVRVDLTTDGGKTWETADLFAQDSAKPGRHWGWTLWRAELPVDTEKKNIEIWVKAVDSNHNVQPETVENIWNFRGLLNNAYHKVKVELQH